MDEADWDHLESRAHALLEDEGLWPAWWAAATPQVERWLSSPTFAGRIATDEDHRREVVVLVWEKLQERDYAKLRTFFERPRDQSEDAPGRGRRFRAWLRRVVKNIGIDYQRSLPEFLRKRAASPQAPPPTASAPSHAYWISIVSITSNVAVFRDPLEGRAEAQRMLDFLDQEVSERRRRAVELHRAGRSSEEVARALGLRDAREATRVVARAEDRLKFRHALELWSHGFSDEEIAEKLDLESAAAAERMIKAAKELLRRSFRP
jgi:DNA-directed RNA polymerase specialized sigma24 family protein